MDPNQLYPLSFFNAEIAENKKRERREIWRFSSNLFKFSQRTLSFSAISALKKLKHY
jgi:hypothetical protein